MLVSVVLNRMSNLECVILSLGIIIATTLEVVIANAIIPLDRKFAISAWYKNVLVVHPIQPMKKAQLFLDSTLSKIISYDFHCSSFNFVATSYFFLGFQW